MQFESHLGLKFEKSFFVIPEIRKDYPGSRNVLKHRPRITLKGFRGDNIEKYFCNFHEATSTKNRTFNKIQICTEFCSKNKIKKLILIQQLNLTRYRSLAVIEKRPKRIVYADQWLRQKYRSKARWRHSSLWVDHNIPKPSTHNH